MINAVIVAVLGLSGYAILWFIHGWETACAVFLVHWSINMDIRKKLRGTLNQILVSMDTHNRKQKKAFGDMIERAEKALKQKLGAGIKP